MWEAERIFFGNGIPHTAFFIYQKTVSYTHLKYLLFYGALLGTGVIASVLCGVLDSFTYRNGFLEIAASTGGVIVVYMLVTVFMLPLFFKLGAEKARVAMTLCFILPFLLIVWGFSWLGDGAAAFVESLPWPMIATVRCV